MNNAFRLEPTESEAQTDTQERCSTEFKKQN